MEQFKRVKVVMLPTNNDRQGIYLSPITTINKIHYTTKRILNSYIAQHLYIISDDEIKEGDWYLTPKNTLCKCIKKDNKYVYSLEGGSSTDCKKIIASTDTSLTWIEHDDSVPYPKGTQYRLPQPSLQFIEKYIEEYNKGNMITDVLVEYEIKSNAGLGHNEWVYLQHIEGKRYIPVKIEANIHQDTYELGKEDIFEDFEVETNLKINQKDNTITIKKIKDS